MKKTITRTLFYGSCLVALAALLLLPSSQGFIPDRNTGYEPGMVTVTVSEPNKLVEPGSEAVFEAILRNDNPARVYIHVEIIPLSSEWGSSISKNDFFLEARSSESIFITLKRTRASR